MLFYRLDRNASRKPRRFIAKAFGILMVLSVVLLATRVYAQGDTLAGQAPRSSPASGSVSPADAPALISPGNLIRICTRTPTFSWSAVAGVAISYQLQVDDISSFGSPEIDKTMISTSYRPLIIPSPLAIGVEYYWRVRYIRRIPTLYISDWSVTWSFTILGFPGIPTLNSPADGHSSCVTTPAFSWGPAPNATGYRLQVDNNADFGTPEISTLAAGTSYTSPSLAEGTYHWRVRAENSCGGSEYSAP